MLLALAIAAVTLVVVATVVLPLMKGARAAPERASFDRAVYLDQLKELERDRGRGLIDADQTAAARLEIERRLLAADAPPEAAAARRSGSPVLAIALALLLPAAARFYLAPAEAEAGTAQAAIDSWQKLAGDVADRELRDGLRARIADAASSAGVAAPALAAPAGPSAEDRARAAQMTPEERQQMIRGMVDGLAVKLKSDPEDFEGWMKLARAYSVLNERDKAADAYEQAARLKPEDPRIPLAEAEALIVDHAPQVPLPERAVALWRRVDTLDPQQPAALWYLGLAAAQQRRLAEASGYLQRLLPLLPADHHPHQMVAAALPALKDKQ